MFEQYFFTNLSNIGNAVQNRFQIIFSFDLMMIAYGKAMRLIANLLKQPQRLRPSGQINSVFPPRQINTVFGL